MANETLSPDELRRKYPATRKEAIAAGARFYFPNKPCSRGHLARRYIASKQCTECAKVWREAAIEDHRRQAREYQYRNSEKVRLRKLAFFYKIRKLRPWEHLLNEARSRAKQFSKEFSLTSEWAAARWTGRCEITNCEFDLIAEKKRTGHPYSPSIDRINNARGYTPDNCRFILFSLNIFKRQMSDQLMLEIADHLVKSAWAERVRQHEAFGPELLRPEPVCFAEAQLLVPLV